MKVLYILNGAFMGGATISFINMIEGLATHEIEPIVIVPRNKTGDQYLVDYMKKRHITYYHAILAPSSLHKPTNMLQFIKICISAILMYLKRVISFYQITSIVRKEKPDIIHTNVGIIREGLKVAKREHIPHILHIREYQDKDFGWLFVPSKQNYEHFIRQSDAVITITDDLRYYFHLQDFPRAETIYNGIYPKDSTILDKDKQPYFCCACRIVPGKGYEDVIEAFSLFHQKHPDYELKIAGQGEKAYIDKLMSLIAGKACNNHIKLLGHLNDVRPLMSRAKALLVASRSEGFGRMTAEAGFNGCLVIGRNTGGTKEILNAMGGFFFSDVPSMVERMEEVALLSKNEYISLASHAQQHAVALYSTESNTEQTYRKYVQLMKTRI